MAALQTIFLRPPDNFMCFLASWDAIEPTWVTESLSQSVSHTVEPTWLMLLWWVKIPTEDFTVVTLAIGDTYGNDVRGGDEGDGHGGW